MSSGWAYRVVPVALALLLAGCGEDLGEATTVEEFAATVDLPFVDGDVSECVADKFIGSPLSERYLLAQMAGQAPPKQERIVGEAVGALAQECWSRPTVGRPTTREIAAGIYYRHHHDLSDEAIECVAEALANSSLSDAAVLARANQLDFTIPDAEREAADLLESQAVVACM